MQSQYRRNQAKSLRNSKNTKRRGSTHPPELSDYTVRQFRTLRFTAVAACDETAISFTDILNTIGVASSATVGYNLYDFVKIVRVRAWGIAALGTPSTVSICFSNDVNSGYIGDGRIHSDTSLGFSPAYVNAKPDPKSFSAIYQTVGAEYTAFTVTCPAGSIIDLDVHFRDQSGQGTAATNALVGATVGALYYRGLDAIAIATSNLVPPSGVYRL